MVASSGFGLIQESADELADAWYEAGSQLRFDVNLNFGRCCVRDCHGMAFVGLRMEQGPRLVCLKHYSALEVLQAV